MVELNPHEDCGLMVIATKDFGNYLVDGEPETTKGGEVQGGGEVEDDSFLRDAVVMVHIGQKAV